MKKFEYLKLDDRDMPTENLNKLGEEGWEFCCQVMRSTWDFKGLMSEYFLFKREIIEDHYQDMGPG